MQMPNKLKFSPAATIFIACLAWWTTAADAQTHTWINGTGGRFVDNANWDIGAPSQTGTAVFDLNQNYTVDIDQDVQIEWLRHQAGSIKYLGGGFLKADEVWIEDLSRTIFAADNDDLRRSRYQIWLNDNIRNINSKSFFVGA